MGVWKSVALALNILAGLGAAGPHPQCLELRCAIIVALLAPDSILRPTSRASRVQGARADLSLAQTLLAHLWWAGSRPSASPASGLLVQPCLCSRARSIGIAQQLRSDWDNETRARARDTRLSHGADVRPQATHSALSRSPAPPFYKSCPSLRIPRNFHLTGRGISTAELEFPVSR
jgi:hypothetical protein